MDARERAYAGDPYSRGGGYGSPQRGPRDASGAGAPRGDDSLRADESNRYELGRSKASACVMEQQSALAAHHHVEDRRLSLFGGGERALQRAVQFGAVFDALAVEAEMASQPLIVRSV